MILDRVKILSKQFQQSEVTFIISLKLKKNITINAKISINIIFIVL